MILLQHGTLTTKLTYRKKYCEKPNIQTQLPLAPIFLNTEGKSRGLYCTHWVSTL